MSQISEEIKSKIDLVDLISEYIPLKPGGANFKANCPFHQEKTPSFMVSRPKQIWHCFGCAAGGDIFGFVMKIEGLEFPEALRLLADRAGVKLPAFSSEISSSLRNRLLDILKLAAQFYHKTLLDSPRAENARQYLAERGLAEETIRNFQIGYIPEEWDALTGFLLKKGFGINDLEAAGLTIKKQEASVSGRGYYDRFRDRIMFPINDVYGNTVGFTGRLLNPEKTEVQGKYVNTPQTAVFDKSKAVFGLDKAKQEIRRRGQAVLVEGQMDVIACHQAGQFNVVASSGTALTLEQTKLLKRFTENLLMAFDADAAGRSAAERGTEVALREGMGVRIISLPPEAGKDPDECLKKNPLLWFEAVEKAVPYMEYLFSQTLSEKDLGRPEDRSATAKILLQKIIQIPDIIEQDFWLKKLSGILDVETALLRERLSEINRRPAFKKDPSSPAEEILPSRKNRDEAMAERLLSMVLQQPEIHALAVEKLNPQALPPPFKELFGDFNLFKQTDSSLSQSPAEVIHSFLKWKDSKDVCQIVDILELLFEKEFSAASSSELLKEALQLASSLNLWYIDGVKRRLEKEMREAEKNRDAAKIEELSKQYRELS